MDAQEHAGQDAKMTVKITVVAIVLFLAQLAAQMIVIQVV